MSRDYGRTAVYNVEDAAWEDTPLNERPGFGALAMEAAELFATPWWQALGVPAPVITQLAPNNCVAGLGGYDGVDLVHTASRATMCHEIAHYLDARITKDHKAHGQKWRGWYILVVRVLYGPQYYMRLSQAFYDYRLSYYPPKLPLLPERAPAVDIDKVLGEVRGGWRPGK